MSTTNAATHLHFVMVPLMCRGHVNPMFDLGLLLAQRGAQVSIVTTPVNVARLQPSMERISSSSTTDLRFQLVSISFPWDEVVGLPEGYECFDLVPTEDAFKALASSISLLEKPLKQYLLTLPPLPKICIVSDFSLPWIQHVSRELRFPRLVFYPNTCFALYSHLTLQQYYDEEGAPADDDPKQFLVPRIPHKVVVTRARAPGFFPGQHNPARLAVADADATADGFVVNAVLEMEGEYVQMYRQAMGKNVWPVGPVSLVHNVGSSRGASVSQSRSKGSDSNSAGEEETAAILEWLGSMPARSVLYVCLGSLAATPRPTAEELGMGLEASGHPFLWVVRPGEKVDEVEEWLAAGFEERNRGKSMVVRGCAPQVLILAHPSIGGFLSHCGWNSTIESLSNGVPMATWPCFAEQFLNERFVVDILRAGVAVGVERPVWWWSDDVPVGREKVTAAVKKVMDEGEEREELRARASDLREKARRAVEIGGSSHLNLTALIAHVFQLVQHYDRD